MNARLQREWWQPAWAGSNGNGQVLGRVRTANLQGHVSRITFMFLMAFTLILYLSPQAHFSALKPLHLALVFAVLAGGFYLRDRFRYGVPAGVGISPYAWAAMLVFWAIITIPFSFWPGGSVQLLTGLFLKAVVIFWLLGRVVNTATRLKVTAWILTLCSIPLSFSGVMSLRSGAFAQELATNGAARIAGYQAALTANPNALALTLVLILPLSLALILLTKRFTLRAFLIAVSFFDVVAVVATYSRGGFLALATVLIGYAIVMWRRGNGFALALLVVLGLAAIPMLPASYMHRLTTIVAFHEDSTGSAQARLQGMQLAAGYAFSHPVVGAGIGMNMYELNQLRGSSGGHEVHDVYLKYAMDLGFPGLALFLLLFYSVLKSCYRSRRFAASRGDQGDLYFLSQGIMISLITFGVAALFSPAAYQFYFFYFAGLAAATKTITDRLKADEAPAESADAPKADENSALLRRQ